MKQPIAQTPASVSPIDDHVKDERLVNEIRQDSGESGQAAVIRFKQCEKQIATGEHSPNIGLRPAAGPPLMLVQFHELAHLPVVKRVNQMKLGLGGDVGHFQVVKG
jgi:hypothetical protein